MMPMRSDQIHGTERSTNAHQRQYAHDEPVEAQEGYECDRCFAGRSDEHQTQNDSCDALK
jgi:hypothetical protein